ncbi:MAG: UDP-N-acetylmuramate:L-alanyl-gamma-D-glutamyl-meso-diaminopimelate ligase [Desulfamplus sp.]|nr:UDP-N-acetylmuramate:L-alanyl-gamma-D-glutamyl-meso-diaminopimelate ligase [Desulfamplus sp.]
MPGESSESITASSGADLFNPAGNHIPPNVRKIHLIAACGTGMGALACMLGEMGFHVTGSDHNVYPPMSHFLMEKGVTLFDGYRAANLDNSPDLIVIGNAVSRGNVEAEEVLKRGMAYCSMPQALNHFAGHGKKKIVVTGTHGKTTTASLIAHILHFAGLDPTFMIGGIIKGFQSNYRIGKGSWIIIEGDEYDTAFFDKGPKFMHYPPDVAVITGVEFDHADIFRDLPHIKDFFRKFVNKISRESLILACAQGNTLSDILPAAKCHIEYYGINEEEYPLAWSFSGLARESAKTRFTLINPAKESCTVKTSMMGSHNALNTIAAFGAAKRAGVADEVILDALNHFKGIRRRQEIRGIKNGITVMDDFAHHPSAVRETIAAVKPFFTGGRLIAVFEPRTNSSMRDIFQADYAASFDDADIACVREPSMLEKIPENERLSTKQMVMDIAKRGVDAFYFEDTCQIIDFIVKSARPQDVVLIMSNGGFDNIHEQLLEQL